VANAAEFCVQLSLISTVVIVTNSRFTTSYIGHLSSVIRVCERLSSISYRLSTYQLTGRHSAALACHQTDEQTTSCGRRTDVNTRRHGTCCIDIGLTLYFLEGIQYSNSSIKICKLWNSLQTARLTFRTLCVMLKLNKIEVKNWTFHIWYSKTVDKHSLTY